MFPTSIIYCNGFSNLDTWYISWFYCELYTVLFFVRFIFDLIKKRTEIVKYMLGLKDFKSQIIDHKRINEILKKIKYQTKMSILAKDFLLSVNNIKLKVIKLKIIRYNELKK